MITPRSTRLLHAADLRGVVRGVASALRSTPGLAAARDCAVITPSRAAAAQLTRSLERLLLAPRDAERAKAGAPLVWPHPHFCARDGLYELLHQRLGGDPPRLNQFEREALLRGAAADAVESGRPAPFALRPAVVAEMLALYDALRRLRTLDQFERAITGKLSGDEEFDRGAARLLQQTAFLAHSFRSYERRMGEAGQIDEHALRALLLERPCDQPLRRVVVTVADHEAEAGGLWLADYDLLARIEGLEHLDIVASDALLATGFRERLHERLPGIAEERIEGARASAPRLIAPHGIDRDAPLHHVLRDREDELTAIAVRLAASPGASHAASLSRTAIVHQRPLPYVYLARAILPAAGIPYQTWDALPLAAEPVAAAFDLALDCISSGWTRPAVCALLRSPHFVFHEETRTPMEAVRIFERALASRRFLGGRDELRRIADELVASPSRDDLGAADGAAAAVRAADALAPLDAPAPRSDHAATLLTFLEAFWAPAAPIEETAHETEDERDLEQQLLERTNRARGALVAILKGLRDAYRRFHDHECGSDDIILCVRRAIEAQTFSPKRGERGVHLVDPRSAGFGEFDEMFFVGLVEGDWPERGGGRSIFYPSSLLTKEVGWPDESERIRAARALFADLARAPQARLHVSTVTLEDDMLVEPAALLDDLGGLGLSVQRDPPASGSPLTPALFRAAPRRSIAWRALRSTRTPSSDAIFHGAVGPLAVGVARVNRIEQYLDCPFRYWAQASLRLEEELEDEDGASPRAHGVLVHDILARCYAEWDSTRRGAVTPRTIADARTLFRGIAEQALARLSAGEAMVARLRLFGSAAEVGLIERLLEWEVESPPVRDRLLEYTVDGAFTITDGDGERQTAIRGRADRIDLCADGTLRVIDYKTGRARPLDRAVQVAVYSVAAAQQIERRTGQRWRPGDSGYLAFGEKRLFVPIAQTDRLEDSLVEGQRLFLNAIDGIARGECPPAPADLRICATCPYPTVCRKDFVAVKAP